MAMLSGEDVPLYSRTSLRSRPRAILLSLLGLVVGLFVALGSPAASASTEPRPGGEQPETTLVPDGTLIPELTITFGDGEASPRDIDLLLSDLRATPGVAFASVQALDETPRIAVGFDARFEASGLGMVRGVIADQLHADNMVIEGRLVIDEELIERTAGSSLWAAVVAALALGALVTWLVGWVHGLLSGTTTALAGFFGGMVGAQATGPFDGSVVTTAIPATLAAVLVSGYLCLRLLEWFADPSGDDQAELIRRSISSISLELFLLFATLAITTIFLELVGPARSVSTVVLLGAITGVAMTLAVMAPALAVLGVNAPDPATTDPAVANGVAPSQNSGDQDSVDGADPDALADVGNIRRTLPSPPVDGRSFPVGVLLGFGVFLAVFGLLAFRSTPAADLLDERALGAETATTDSGDPTNAILAVFPVGTDQSSKTAWLERMAQLPSVARIETSVGRYLATEFIEVDGGTAGPLGPQFEGDEAPGFAIIVPNVSGRGLAARELVESINATNEPVDAELSGTPVDARRADSRGRSLVLLTIVVLALAASVGAFILIGDLGLAAIVAGLRVLTSAAVVGLSHLLSDQVSGADLQLIIIVSAIGIGCFELTFLRRLLRSHRSEPSDGLVSRALADEGWTALVGFAGVIFASLGLLLSDLASVRRVGILLAVGALIEIVVGCWLLRPAILGTRSISHFASLPVSAALRALKGLGVVDEASHQRWSVVVSNLLHSEFAFQADPGAADMDAVFVANTPLYSRAIAHHESLAKAGLRIIGRPPQLRNARVVGEAAPTTVAVTIDHPTRQLVDSSGTIVGVRKAERRSSMLWLREFSDGSYRIADSVELGTTALGIDEEPASAEIPAGIPASIES